MYFKVTLCSKLKQKYFTSVHHVFLCFLDYHVFSLATWQRQTRLKITVELSFSFNLCDRQYLYTDLKLVNYEVCFGYDAVCVGGTLNSGCHIVCFSKTRCECHDNHEVALTQHSLQFKTRQFFNVK